MSIDDHYTLHIIKSSLIVSIQVVIKCGDASIAMKKDGTITIKGKDLIIQGNGSVSVRADSDVVIKGSKILQN